MTRSSNRSAQFAHAFLLEGVEGLPPLSSYAIEETREPVEGLAYIGYRLKRTTIELPGASSLSRQLVEIEPADLEAALARDIEASNVQP